MHGFGQPWHFRSQLTTETVIFASDGVTLSQEYVSPDDRVLVALTNEGSSDVLISRAADSLTTEVDGTLAGAFTEHLAYLGGTHSAVNLSSQLSKGQSVFITFAGAGTCNAIFQLSEIPVFT